jgi:hypothetical protein
MFEIPALIAMIVGAGMQYKANSDAAKRAEQATMQSLQKQRGFQKEAESEAKNAADKYQAETRAEKQQEIEQNLNTEYMQPVEAAQTINQEGATTQGDVSSDYVAAKATSDANTLNSSRNLAKLLAKTSSAGNLRMGEGFDLADSTTKVGQIGSFAKGQAAVDEILIKQAAQPSAGLMGLGQLISALGSFGAMSGALSGAGSAAASGATTAGGLTNSVMPSLTSTILPGGMSPVMSGAISSVPAANSNWMLGLSQLMNKRRP